MTAPELLIMGLVFIIRGVGVAVLARIRGEW